MRKHRIALIGLGMAVTPHAKSLVDLADRVEVAAAYSRAAPRRSEFAARFAFPTSSDLEAIIADTSIDAALVLTPPRTHLPLVARLAAAGKHVLLEKPVEADTARAEAVVETCERAGVALGIVFQQRFQPAARLISDKIRNGELGEIAAASVAARWWRPQSYYDQAGRGTIERDGGGVLMTQAIHILDLLLTLTPPVVEVVAFAGTSMLHRMETEDIAVGALRFANGALGSVDASTASFPGFPERLEIIGALGTAVFARGKAEVYFRDGRKETLGHELPVGLAADPMAFPNDAHRALLREFFDALDAGRPPTNSGRDALKVHYLIDALLASSRNASVAAVRS
jgi:predicted dehydrogenase